MTVGTIALVDFRLLGFGLRRQSAPELAKALAPWTLFGLILVAAVRSDAVLLRPGHVLPELVVPDQDGPAAAGDRVSLHGPAQVSARRVVARPEQALACLSLALWTSMIFGGNLHRVHRDAGALTMSVLEFAQWIQSTDWATYLRMSAYLYPAILSSHLTGIALFAGAVLVTDLRLLGVVLRNQPVADVVNQLRWPKRIGFLIVATCGVLLASSKAEEYYYNTFFRIKLTLFVLVAVHALVFRGSVYNNAAALDQARRMPGKAKLAAALSLLLWISIACVGRGIGYIEPPLDKLHAALSGEKSIAGPKVNSVPV